MTQAHSLATAGAKMLDLGAESTRPGALPVSPNEEWARLEPALVALRQALPDLPLSLDTRHAEVAKKGLALGVSVINDVTGFSDSAMLDLAINSRCGLIAMRSRRSRRSRRSSQGADHFFMPDYANAHESSINAADTSDTTDAAEAIIDELLTLKHHLTAQGIAPGRVLLDPGFGFGTTFNEDMAIWTALPTLSERLDWPASRICLGLSRKRFLAWRNGTPQMAADQRDGLTSSAHAEALTWGYRVFRTHALP